MTLAEVETLTAETSTSSKGLAVFLLILFSLGFVSAQGDYYYPDQDQGNSMSGWGTVPEFDSQEEIVQQFVAPFLFIVVLLQFSLKKALAFTFSTDDREPYDILSNNDKPNVNKEATVMSVAIALMMVASPYWAWVQAVATGLGLAAMLGLVLTFMFLIYLFIRP